eukprot:1194252-Prorocentrum_minimum.AAC.9
MFHTKTLRLWAQRPKTVGYNVSKYIPRWVAGVLRIWLDEEVRSASSVPFTKWRVDSELRHPDASSSSP